MWTLPTIFIFWPKENRPILIQYLSSTDQTFSSYSLLSLLCQKVYHCSTLVRSSGHAAIFKCYAGRTVQNLIKRNYLSINFFPFSKYHEGCLILEGILNFSIKLQNHCSQLFNLVCKLGDSDFDKFFGGWNQIENTHRD